MRRRDFIGLIPGAMALHASGAAGQGSPSAAARPASQAEVNVKRDFGARGDGVTDDWAAIENAGLHLERQGGGRMYFPAGHYRLPRFGYNVRTRSNIEYCGDGDASWIDANNCAFSSATPSGGLEFTVGDFPKYRYFAAADVAAGQRVVSCRDAKDAANFSPGDFIYIRSLSQVTLGKEAWPYFSEYSRVVASDPVTGTITLEDSFEDGWSGLQVARLAHGSVAANYSIHHLRLSCSAGFPLFVIASYKARIHDVWTEGWSALTVNAFTRSEFRDAICEINWHPGARQTAAVIEIETGSVRASVENVTCNIRSMDGTQNPGEIAPVVFTQEFSRHTSVRNCRFLAPGVELGHGVFSKGAGHRYEGLTFVARSFDNIMRFVCDDNLAPLADVPRSARDINVSVTQGYKCAIGLIGTRLGPCSNVTVDGFKVSGDSGGGAAVVLTPAASRIRLNDLDVDGKLYRHGEGAITDVAVYNSRFGGFADKAMLDLCDVVNFRRRGSPPPPVVVTSGDQLVSSNAAHSVFTSIAIPSAMEVADGDSIDIHASIYKARGPYTAHVAIRALGAIVEMIEIAGGVETYLDIRARVLLLRSGNGGLRAFACLGTLTRNNAVKNLPQVQVDLDARRTADVALEIWGDWPGASDNISVRSSRLAYELVENKKPF